MNKEELLKEIMKLPKVETINPISAMNVINVDDLMSAVNRFDKVPDYNDLLKENQELKKQLKKYQKELEKADSITQSCIFNGKEESKISFRKCLNILDKKETQQKEFIKWLEDYLNLFDVKDIYEEGSYDTIEEILQKYKEIIGDDK